MEVVAPLSKIKAVPHQSPAMSLDHKKSFKSSFQGHGYVYNRGVLTVIGNIGAGLVSLKKMFIHGQMPPKESRTDVENCVLTQTAPVPSSSRVLIENLLAAWLCGGPCMLLLTTPARVPHSPREMVLYGPTCDTFPGPIPSVWTFPENIGANRTFAIKFRVEYETAFLTGRNEKIAEMLQKSSLLPYGCFNNCFRHVQTARSILWYPTTRLLVEPKAEFALENTHLQHRTPLGRLFLNSSVYPVDHLSIPYQSGSFKARFYHWEALLSCHTARDCIDCPPAIVT